MTEYKAVLHQWHKGTGGGPGLDIYFESWSAEKLNKYDILLDEYDHTVVANRPAIVIENYCQDPAKKPYLTLIHLWDDLSGNLLSSKFDPFCVAEGEIGMPPSNEDESSFAPTSSSAPTLSSSSTIAVTSTPSPSAKCRKKKRKPTKSNNVIEEDRDDLRGAIKAVLKMQNAVSTTTSQKRSTETKLEDLPLNDLFDRMNQHKDHLKFLQENDMCSQEEKEEIVQRVKEIYKVISCRSKSNKSLS